MRFLRPTNLFRTVRSRRMLGYAGIVFGVGAAGYLMSLTMYPAQLVARDQRVGLVIGLPVEEAERELTTQGFRIQVDPARERDPTLPEGYVTWQEPAAYVALPEGSLVELTLSSGPAAVTVPDVLQFESEEARKVLMAAGLMVSAVDSVPAQAEPGVVVATRPPAGAARTPGSVVDLVVSEGPAAIRVPNVVDHTEAEARDLLEASGLRIGTVRRVRRAGPPGTVLEQDPRPGVLRAQGARVDLTVRETRRS